MTSFVPASNWMKAGLCIPVVGFYFMISANRDPWANSDNLANVARRICEQCENTRERQVLDQELGLREKIVHEWRVLNGCTVTQGLLSIITAVAIASLQGIVAISAGVALGLYGVFMLCVGCRNLYNTVGYQPTPQMAS